VRVLFAALLLIVGSAAIAGEPGAASDEAAIRAVVAAWYEELAKKHEGRPWNLAAPGFIDATPHYRHIDTGAASLGPQCRKVLKRRAVDTLDS
jgi:hypothetical protein